MKAILIERVSNGWIVRNQDCNPIKFSSGEPFVYIDLESLQRDLPNLLSIEQTKAASSAPTAMNATEIELEAGSKPPFIHHVKA